jgi:regulatory protein
MQRHRAGRGAKRPRGPAKIADLTIDLDALGDPLVVSEMSGVSGRSDRLRVAINGTPAGDVTLDFVADQALREGKQLTRAEADGIIAAVRRTIVVDKALDLLAVRARSSRDLRVRLKRIGAADPDVSWAIDRLIAQGFVDDAAYARQVARAKVVSGGVSKRKVVTVLRKRGVSADVAAEAIDATLEEVELDEYGAALAAAQKRVRALSSLDAPRRKQRLYAFLARRGYESDVVRKVLAEVLNESGRRINHQS